MRKPTMKGYLRCCMDPAPDRGTVPIREPEDRPPGPRIASGTTPLVQLLLALTAAALAGTMNGWPAPARMASNGSLSPVSEGIGMNFMSKSLGVDLSCSFSSQEPQGMKAALYWFHAVCDSMCVRPLVPGSR